MDELPDREMEKFDTFLGQSVVEEVCLLGHSVELTQDYLVLCVK